MAMSDDDLTTVSMKSGVDPEDAPLAPADPVDVEIDSGEVMGAVRVANADERGGVWDLTLTAGFATRALDVVEVDDRLTPGTYAVVRLDGDGDE